MSDQRLPKRKLDHWVNEAPFDPVATEKLTPEQERYYMASQ